MTWPPLVLGKRVINCPILVVESWTKESASELNIGPCESSGKGSNVVRFALRIGPGNRRLPHRTPCSEDSSSKEEDNKHSWGSAVFSMCRRL